jgi:hypothetical protein
MYPVTEMPGSNGKKLLSQQELAEWFSGTVGNFLSYRRRRLAGVPHLSEYE